jgi:hypothetical protein
MTTKFNFSRVISNLLIFIPHLESRRIMPPSPTMVNVPHASSGTRAHQIKAHNAFINEVEGAVNNHTAVLNDIAGRHGR